MAVVLQHFTEMNPNSERNHREMGPENRQIERRLGETTLFRENSIKLLAAFEPQIINIRVEVRGDRTSEPALEKPDQQIGRGHPQVLSPGPKLLD